MKPRGAREEGDAWDASLHRFGVRKDIEEEMGSVNVMPQADDNAPARCFDVIPPILPGVHYATDTTNKYRLETKLISVRQLRDYRQLDYGVSC